MLSITILFFALATVILGFEEFAEPIQLAEPNKDGVYEFTLVVDSKLTMSYDREVFNYKTPVDYDPDARKFTSRNTTAGSECQASIDKVPFEFGETQNFVGKLSDIIMADGLHRRIVAINGKSPGPLLVVPFNAEVHLIVHNMLYLESFSIHVHGIDKKGQWYEDGVAFIQQCPIQTGGTYEYRFIADRSGTHWWHGHLQMDRGDGLLGGFVVLPENRTVPTAGGTRVLPKREYYMILQDYVRQMPQKERVKMVFEDTTKWYYGFQDPKQCFDGLRMSDGSNVGAASPFDTILINDKGWYNDKDIKQRPEMLKLETFRIKKGETLLFRIVNGAANTNFMIHIRGHQMTLVGADGNEMQPITADKFIIMPGERYDFVTKGLDNPTQKVYYLQVETLQYLHGTKIDKAGLQYGLGRIYYEDEEDREIVPESPAKFLHPECTKAKKCKVYNCPFKVFPPGERFECIPFSALRSPSKPTDPEIVKDTNFDQGFEEHFVNMQFDTNVNGWSFKMPKGMPYFHEQDLYDIATPCNQTLCANAPRHDLRCRCFFHLRQKLGNIIQLTLYNMHATLGLAAHPIHIHGHHVNIMKMGWPKTNSTGQVVGMNEDLNCSAPFINNGDKVLNYCNSLEWANKTLAQRGGARHEYLGGYVVLRYRAINPGWWFLHCHLELHASSGSAFAFKIGDDSQIPKPPATFPHDCGLYRNPEISQLARDFRDGKPIYFGDEDDWRRQVVWRREPKSYRPPPTPEEKLETELRQRRDHQVKVYAKFLKDTVAVHGTKPTVFESCTQMWNTIREELEHRIALKTTPSRIDEELRLFDEACDALLRVKFGKGMP
ncbi:unnamed protein product, partial [Mesorhabditis spiculigera]